MRSQAPPSKLVLAALVLLGFTAGLPEYIGFPEVSLHLALAIALASLGWLWRPTGPAVRSYTFLAGVLGIWFCVSAIATWDVGTLFRSLIAVVWLVIVAPGQANLLRERSHRRALLAGMIGAALTYSLTALGRRATGRDMFDMPNPSRALILGEKRGYVSGRLLFVLPFLVANTSPIVRRVRWLVLIAGGATIVLSGGRAGLLGLAVVALAFALLQPGTDRKVKGLLAAVLLAVVLVMTVSEFGGQAVVAQNRLLAFIRGERTSSDDIRELQLKRAWRVGWENPIFGVGFNNLSGLDHPALDEARNSNLRRRAQVFGVHNTYAQIFGELGLPGVIAFLALVGSILLAGIRKRGDPEVRAATSGFAGLLFMMMVNPMSLPFLYLTLAYIVGLLDDERHEPRRADHRRGASIEV